MLSDVVLLMLSGVMLIMLSCVVLLMFSDVMLLMLSGVVTWCLMSGVMLFDVVHGRTDRSEQGLNLIHHVFTATCQVEKKIHTRKTHTQKKQKNTHTPGL